MVSLEVFLPRHQLPVLHTVGRAHVMRFGCLLTRSPLVDMGVNVTAIQMFIPTSSINKPGKNSSQANHQ